VVVVEVVVVVSQYIKNLPSLFELVGSSAPESRLGRNSSWSSNELEERSKTPKIKHFFLPCPLRINLASLS
jgi:hypothetical protein